MVLGSRAMSMYDLENAFGQWAFLQTGISISQVILPGKCFWYINICQVVFLGNSFDNLSRRLVPPRGATRRSPSRARCPPSLFPSWSPFGNHWFYQGFQRFFALFPGSPIQIHCWFSSSQFQFQCQVTAYSTSKKVPWRGGRETLPDARERRAPQKSEKWEKWDSISRHQTSDRQTLNVYFPAIFPGKCFW